MPINFMNRKENDGTETQGITAPEVNTEVSEPSSMTPTQEYFKQIGEKAEETVNTRNENINRYGIALPDDIYESFAPAINEAEDPDEEAHKIGMAYKYSQQYGISLTDAYNQVDDFNKALWDDGKVRTNREWYKVVSDYFRMGNNNVKQGQLGQELIKAELTGDTDSINLINQQIEVLNRDNELCYDSSPRNWAVEALKAGAQSLPYTGYSAAAGMIGNFVAPAVGTAGAFAASSYLTQGQEYIDMRAQGIRPEIARNVSLVDGAIQGLVEASLGEVAGMAGGVAANMGKKAIGNAVRDTVVDKVAGSLAKRFHFSAGKKLLAAWGTRYVMNLAEEGSEEVIQQATGDISKNIAISQENKAREEELQAALDKVREDLTPTLEAEIRKEYPQLDEMSFNEIVKDSMDQFIGGVAGAVVLGIAPTAIRAPVDIKNYLAVKDAAQTIESEEAFKKFVKEDPAAQSVFENIEEDQRDNIIDQVWKEGQSQADLLKKEDIKESKDLGDNAEESPVDETGERIEKKAEYRNESGELYTEYDTSYGETNNGKTTGRFMIGDPSRTHSLEEGGNRYGYIDYTVKGDEITIDNFRMTPGRENLSKEFFSMFAEENAGMNINWSPKFDTNMNLREELIAENPRGSAEGLNYFASGEDVAENKTYLKLARQLKENTPNLTNEQAAAEIGIIRAASRAQGLSTEDFINNTFENGQLVTSEATPGIIQGEAALNQGKAENDRVSVLGATELQRSGKSILYVAKNGDFNTLVHETGHILENYLTPEERNTVLSQFGGDKNGKWNTATSEKFADALVDYLRSGTTNNKGMENIFKKAAQFIADIFRGFQGRVELSPELKEVYDSLLQDDGSGLSRAMYAVSQNEKRTTGRENYNSRVKEEANTTQETENNVRENEQSNTEENVRGETEENKNVTTENAETKEEVKSATDKTMSEIDSTTDEKAHDSINESSVNNAENAAPYDLFQIISSKSLPIIRKEAINKQLTSDLEKAKAMYTSQEWQFKDKGDLMRRIKRATGWELFNDKWVHEFDERNYNIDTKFINGLLSLTPEQLQYAHEQGMFNNKSALSDIIPDAELYDYFPGLKNVSVQFINNASYKWRGATDGRGITFNLANIKSSEGVLGFRGVLTHEVQHIIQGLEGDSPFHRQALVGKAVAYDIGSLDDKISEVNSEYEARYIQQRVEEINREILLTDKTENKPLYQVIGEKGALELDRVEEVTTRQDNLNIAERMESENKDALTIRRATGWERGADGKWKFETPEDLKLDTFGMAQFKREHLKYKRISELEEKEWNDETTKEEEAELEELYKTTEIPKVEPSWNKLANSEATLRDVILNDDLLNAYPDLGDVKLYFGKIEGDIFTKGMYVPSENAIVLFWKDPKSLDWSHNNDTISTLTHEIQHFIQRKEGFATGGNVDQFEDVDEQGNLDITKNVVDNRLKIAEEAFNKASPELQTKFRVMNRAIIAQDFDKLEELENSLNEEDRALWDDYYAKHSDALQANEDKVKVEPYEAYRRLAGEVESRNVQKRIGMSAEERLNTLLSKTQDIDTRDQIVMFETLKAMSEVEKSKQENDVRSVYENTKDWMKAPNGKDTHLTEKQWLQVRTPNFKAWFGDWENDPLNSSRVVDENGEPLVVYHGTIRNGKKFDTFRTESPAWFSTSKEYAEEYYSDKKFYQKGDLYPVFLNLRNAQDMGNIDIGGTITLDEVSNRTGIPLDTLKAQNFSNTNMVWNVTNDEKFKSLLPGKDGIKAEEQGVTTYAVFNPNQIKSATDNNGDFSNTNNSIKYQFETIEEARKEYPNIVDLSDVESKNKSIKDVTTYLKSIMDDITVTQDGHKISMSDDVDHIVKSNKYATLPRRGKENLKKIALSIKDVINNSVYFNSMTNKDPRKIDTDHFNYYKAPVWIGNRGYKVILECAVTKKSTSTVAIPNGTHYTESGSAQKDIIMHKKNVQVAGVEYLYNIKDRELPENKLNFQTAYHGTSANFEAFSNEHINEGEGSQSFGWGTYFTESEAIARDYATRQAAIKTGGDLEEQIKQKEEALKILQDKLSSIPKYEDWKEEREKRAKYYEYKLTVKDSPMTRAMLSSLKNGTNEESYNKEVQVVQNDIDQETKEIEELKSQLESLKDSGGEIKRNLYTVEIPDSKYLTWEKAVPKALRERVKKDIYNELIKGDYKGAEKELAEELSNLFDSPVKGQTFYNDISIYLGGDKNASMFLKDHGIVGMNYPAGSNFGTPDGKEARNFVIYDDRDVSITDHINFQTDEELLNDALQFNTWEEFRDSYMFDFGPQFEDDTYHDKVPGNADDEWYKNTWERAHEVDAKNTYNDDYVKEVRGDTEETETLKDQQWFSMMEDEPLKLDDFLRAIADAAISIDENVQPSDQEELDMLNHKEALKSRYGKELRHGFWASATLKARATKAGEEVPLTPKERKTLMSLMRNSKRDYRDLYSDFMLDKEWKVADGSTTSDKLRARLQSPDEEFENKTPELRRAIADRLDFEDLKEELKDGSLEMDLSKVQKLADGYETEIGVLNDKIEALKKQNEKDEIISLKKEAQLEKLNEELKEKQRQKTYLNNIRDIKIRLIKAVNRKVDFKTVDYEAGRKVIAIQALFQPKLKKFVNQYLNSEGEYLRDAYSKYRTDFSYRTKLQSIAEGSNSRNLKQAIKIMDLKSFDKWTEDDITLVASCLPRTDWVTELNLEKIMEDRAGSLQLDFQSKEVQDLLKEVLPENLYAKLSQADVKDWTLEDMEDLVNVTNDIRQEGQMELRARNELRLTRAAEYRRKIEKALKSNGIVINADDTPEEKERKQRLIEKFKKNNLPKILGTSSSIKGTLAYSNEKRQSKLSRIINGYSDANVRRVARILDNGKDGLNTTLLYMREDQCFNEEQRSITRRTANINKAMEDNNIEIQELFNKVHVNFADGSADFTVDELMYFTAAMDDANSAAAVMYGNMYDETVKAQYRETGDVETYKGMAEARMSCVLNEANKLFNREPKFKAFMEAIEKDYGEQYERMNKVSIEEFNSPVWRVEHYVPLNRLESSGDTNANRIKQDLLGMSGAPGNNYVDKGMTKKRIEISPVNQKPVMTGLYSTWAESLNRTEHFLSYAGYVRELNRVYKSRDAGRLRQYMENRYGKAMTEYIDDYINEVANPESQQAQTDLDRFAHILRGKTAPAYLAWKMSGVIKQLCTSPWPYLQYMNPAEYAAACFDIIKSRGKMDEAIRSKSAFMNSRKFDPIVDLIDEQAEKATTPITHALNSFESLGMQGLEWADWACVAPGWLASYRKEVARLSSEEEQEKRVSAKRKELESYRDVQGEEWIEEQAQNARLSEGDIEALAVRKADDIVRMTQPSNRLTDLSPMFKQRGPGSEISRIFLQFTTSLNVIWQNLRYDLPVAVRNKQARLIVGMVAGYMMAGIMMGLVTEGDGTDDKDDEETKKAKRARQFAYYSMTQFTDSVPLIGSIVSQGVKQAVTGEKNYSQGFSDMFPLVTKASTGVMQVEKGDYEKAMNNFMQAAGLSLGLPVSGVKEMEALTGIGDKDGELNFYPQALIGRRPEKKNK